MSVLIVPRVCNQSDVSLVLADYAAGALSHLAEGPEVTDVTPNSVSVCFNQNETFMNKEFSNNYAFQIQVVHQLNVCINLIRLNLIDLCALNVN